MPDIEEIVDMITRILDQAEISEDEVLDLDFEAEGELQVELYILFSLWCAADAMKKNGQLITNSGEKPISRGNRVQLPLLSRQ